MWIIWLVIMLVSLFLEVATVNLVSIWFVLAAMVSLIASLAGLSTLVQIVLFFVLSILGILAFILIFKPKLEKAKERNTPTNADRVIGQEARVIQPIVAYEKPGIIRVLGQEWSAVAEDPAGNIAVGTKVQVVQLSGVKAVVRPL